MSTAELQWFKSSYSDSSEPGDCVEVAGTPVSVHVRDSKTPETARVSVAPRTWAAFLGALKGA
ncbi:DUF397 domain-containing protein [Streptomyces sp. NPDC049915]|uniref:DUF397 domain-containing protein n=1 Tax=Streptomyces sp. NPDC049915 TaxID=3155510 RepID=UPI00341D16A3